MDGYNSSILGEERKQTGGNESKEREAEQERG